jgi:hypothetical protein
MRMCGSSKYAYAGTGCCPTPIAQTTPPTTLQPCLPLPFDHPNCNPTKKHPSHSRRGGGSTNHHRRCMRKRWGQQSTRAGRCAIRCDEIGECVDSTYVYVDMLTATRILRSNTGRGNTRAQVRHGAQTHAHTHTHIGRARGRVRARCQTDNGGQQCNHPTHKMKPWFLTTELFGGG